MCIGHSFYEEPGYAAHITQDDQWGRLEALEDHDQERTVRMALRGIYMGTRRTPQFVDYVRPTVPLAFEYFAGADPDRVTRMLRTGQLESDDPVEAQDTTGEDEVVSAVTQGDWESILRWEDPPLGQRKLRIQQPPGLRWLDKLRPCFPRGDR